MSTNSFQAPGDDTLRQMAGNNSSGLDCILVKSRGGGHGGFARKVRDDRNQGKKEEEPGEAYIPPPAQADEPAKKEGSVKLLNPKWVTETGTFNQKATVSVEAEIPGSLKDITKVTFTLHAPIPQGEDDRIAAAEGHAKDGKATSEYTMFYPSGWGDTSTYESVEYYFKAKHRDSVEVKSPPFRVWKTYDAISLSDSQDIALKITREYEKIPGTGEGYDSLAGNFDGAGVSFGIMQWNIKWGTLQTLLKKFKDQDEAAFKKCFIDKDGKEVEAAITKINEVISEKQSSQKDDNGSAFPEGFKWAVASHTKEKPPYGWVDDWDKHFKRLGEVEAFQKIQREFAIEVNHKETLSKIDWMRKQVPDLWVKVTLRSYCALFDLSNQHKKATAGTLSTLKSQWAEKKPLCQMKMVEQFSEQVAEVSPEWKEASFGRRKGILDGRASSGDGWKKVDNKLLTSLLGTDKYVKDL